MRWIYCSPHLDDAVLCAGGLIHDQSSGGMPVEIWTLMSGVPSDQELSDFAREMHAKWATTTARQTVALRREEDRHAARRVGARAVQFDFLDAIYRRGPDGAALLGDPVGAPRQPADAALPRQMASAMAPRLHADDKVVCLLAIGSHPDHVLVREAAGSLGRPLLYAADVPYVLNHPEEVELRAAGLHASVQTVSEAGMEAWLAAIECYGSQLSTLFDSLDLLREGIRGYWATHGGIRLWSR